MSLSLESSDKMRLGLEFDDNNIWQSPLVNEIYLSLICKNKVTVNFRCFRVQILTTKVDLRIAE